MLNTRKKNSATKPYPNNSVDYLVKLYKRRFNPMLTIFYRNPVFQHLNTMYEFYYFLCKKNDFKLTFKKSVHNHNFVCVSVRALYLYE